MTPEAMRLRAENNLSRLSESEQSTVKCMVCSSVDEARYYARTVAASDSPRSTAILEAAYDYEKAHSARATVLNLIASALKKSPLKLAVESKQRAGKPISIEKELAGYEAAAQKGYLSSTDDCPEVLAPEALITGNPSAALSPLEASALAAVESAWHDASRLAGMVKNYARAGTAAKALCGLRLRALREHYFGPRTVGRPKKSELSTTWDGMIADRLGITRQAAENWMKMADAVEQLADSQGLDLRTTCEKLPWDWTPEESALIDATVHRLTEDKTQRQLLQADFLSDLGYAAPQKPNSSNNPLGKNGGKKKPASSPAALLKERQEAARLLFLGTDKPGRVEKGSVALFMETFITNHGADLEALPQAELRDLYENTVKPFAAAFRKLAGL